MSTFEDAIERLFKDSANVKGKKYKPLPMKALDNTISKTLTLKKHAIKKRIQP